MIQMSHPIYDVLRFQTVGWPRKDKLTSIQYEQLESGQDLNKKFGIQNQIVQIWLQHRLKIDLSVLYSEVRKQRDKVRYNNRSWSKNSASNYY